MPSLAHMMIIVVALVSELRESVHDRSTGRWNSAVCNPSFNCDSRAATSARLEHAEACGNTATYRLAIQVDQHSRTHTRNSLPPDKGIWRWSHGIRPNSAPDYRLLVHLFPPAHNFDH